MVRVTIGDAAQQPGLCHSGGRRPRAQGARGRGQGGAGLPCSGQTVPVGAAASSASLTSREKTLHPSTKPAPPPHPETHSLACPQSEGPPPGPGQEPAGLPPSPRVPATCLVATGGFERVFALVITLRECLRRVRKRLASSQKHVAVSGFCSIVNVETGVVVMQGFPYLEGSRHV